MPALNHAHSLEEAPPENRERLILEHLPQVRLIARRIQEKLPRHIALEDLVSTGTLGLIAAIDNFDPAHRVKLKTYAEYKIRGAILDSLRDMDWAPRKKRKTARRIESAVAEAGQRLQREPTEEETAAELRVSIEQYRTWLVDVRGMNLERLRHGSSEEGRGPIEALPDSPERLPSRLFEERELQRLMKGLIAHLPEVEARILRLYYHEGMTLRQTAGMSGVHESRISQIKTQAIRRLRGRIVKYWPTHSGV